MAESGLKARKTRLFQPHKTDSAQGGPVAANRLNRAFTASAPNQKWVGDVTFIAMQEGEPRRLVVFGGVDGFIQPQNHWLGDE